MEKERKDKKAISNRRGVTLIALVITIVVLLILARSYNKLSHGR